MKSLAKTRLGEEVILGFYLVYLCVCYALIDGFKLSSIVCADQFLSILVFDF